MKNKLKQQEQPSFDYNMKEKNKKKGKNKKLNSIEMLFLTLKIAFFTTNLR